MMSLLLDVRCAIFAPYPLQTPPGFDLNFLVPSLQYSESLVSIEWSSDPSLGLPSKPFEVWVCDSIQAEGLEQGYPDASVDSSTGHKMLTQGIDPAVILYIRGMVAHAEPDARLFALDGAGGVVRETAQIVQTNEPFIVFGPSLGGLGSDRPIYLTNVRVAFVRPNLNVEWRPVQYSAPAMNVHEYAHNVEGQGVLDGRTAAQWRLNGNTLARMSTKPPAHQELETEIHLADIAAAAADFQASKPFTMVEQNFAQALGDPDWSYSETIEKADGTPDDQVETTVHPVAMLQLLKALGPVEASTFGYEMTVASALPPFLTRADIAGALSESPYLPYPLVRVVSHFTSGSVEAYGRLTFADQIVTTQGRSDDVMAPPARDMPATADANITLEYGGWLENYYVERRSNLVAPNVALESWDHKSPKLLTPRAVLKDGSDAEDPWFSDRGLEIGDTNAPEVLHRIFRRDEFGRWPDPLEAATQLPGFPVQPPGILSIELSYDANANVEAVVVLSRSWKLRTPHDIQLGLVIGKTLDDTVVVELTPAQGVTSPELGMGRDLRIVFDTAGVPSIEYGGVGMTPQVTAHDPGPELPDERSYTLRLRLGSAAQLFPGDASEAVLAVTADASNVLGGSERRSRSTQTQVRPILDPRPPVLLSNPWQLVWSSRPNAQNRVRVLLDPPVAKAGTLLGFRVWQASEASIIDFAFAQANDAEKPQMEALARLLRNTVDTAHRVQLLRNRLEPIINTASARKLFFSRFDAVEDHIWPAGKAVEIELSSRHEGPIILLLTGVSPTSVETVDVGQADLRAVAVPDRISDERPFVKVVTNLDPAGATPNTCLLIFGSRQAQNAAAIRVFWDTGDDFQSEEELLERLPQSSCFLLSKSAARQYLEDVDDLIKRLEPWQVSMYLLMLPESWSPHYLTADVLNPSPRTPAEQIPSQRAAMVSCFVQPGTGPRVSVEKQVKVPNGTEWTLDHKGLPLTTPRGYSPSTIYMETVDGGFRAGPIDLIAVLQNGLELVPGGGVVRLVSDGAESFRVTSNGATAGGRYRVVVVDPTNRSASIELSPL